MGVDILGGVTNTDELRAVLGMTSAIEAPDVHFTNFGLDGDLELDLLGWRPDYETIITDGTTLPVSTDEKTQYLLLRKYAKWYCASLILKSGEVFIANLVSDGNAQFKRSLDLSELRRIARAESASAKARLIEEADSTAAATFTVLGKSTPDYDPVAHE